MSSHVILNTDGKIKKLYMLNIMECAYIHKPNICQYVLTYFIVLIQAVHPEITSFGAILNRCRGIHLVWSH